MAEALLNHLGKGKYNAFSAGCKPATSIQPETLEILKRNYIPWGKPRSKSWNEYAARPFNLVISLCKDISEESWPIFPGKPQRILWDIPRPGVDTESKSDTTFERVFQHIKEKIEKLMRGQY